LGLPGWYAAAFRERIAAAERYRKIHGEAVWIVLRYVGDKNVSSNNVLPSGWLKYTKSDQWTNHVREFSCTSAGSAVDVEGEAALVVLEAAAAAADAAARREAEVRESMESRRVLSSSRATSHRPVRMSEASLPQ
jgi:hypothetical protein